MTCAQLFFLKDELYLKVFKTLFDSVRLVAYHHDRLFGFDFVQ